MNTRSFYVHIPFCHRVCPYCKFAVVPMVDEFKKGRYLEYLKSEIQGYFKKGNEGNGGSGGRHCLSGDESYTQAEQGEYLSECPFAKRWKYPWGIGFPPETFGTFGFKSTEIGVGDIIIEDPEINSGGQNTIYFGGGTPSLLSIQELSEVLQCFPFFQQSNLPPIQSSNFEITIETNPEDITEEKANGWKGLGVNRISMGVQSLDDKVLETIGRASREKILEALNILNAHFENINVDFILGLPYSKVGRTLENIQELHQKYTNIVHTSVYILEDERYPKEWAGNYPSEEIVQKEYLQICDYLEERGWHHYEISNWAKSGYESIHNRSYWNHSDYRGFGLSAGSFSGLPFEGKIKGISPGKRFSNVSNFSGYFDGKIEEEHLTKEQLRLEKILFGLRTFSLDEGLIQNTRKLEEYIENGLLKKEEGIIFPTKTGIFMLDYIIGELIV